MTILETPELLLTSLADGDRELFLALYTDPATMRHIGTAMDPATAAQAFGAALRQDRDPAGRQRFWTLRERDGGATIGIMGLTLKPGRVGEVGILIRADRRGRSHAAAAIAALADHVFDDLGLASLDANHAGSNAGTAGLLCKLEFELLTADPAASKWFWQTTPARWRHARGRWRDPAADSAVESAILGPRPIRTGS